MLGTTDVVTNKMKPFTSWILHSNRQWQLTSTEGLPCSRHCSRTLCDNPLDMPYYYYSLLHKLLQMESSRTRVQTQQSGSRGTTFNSTTPIRDPSILDGVKSPFSVPIISYVCLSLSTSPTFPLYVPSVAHQLLENRVCLSVTSVSQDFLLFETNQNWRPIS